MNNNCAFTGEIKELPKLLVTKKGRAYATFSILVTEKSGEYVNSIWVNCVAHGRWVNLAKSFQVGETIAITESKFCSYRTSEEEKRRMGFKIFQMNRVEPSLKNPEYRSNENTQIQGQ